MRIHNAKFNSFVAGNYDKGKGNIECYDMQVLILLKM